MSGRFDEAAAGWGLAEPHEPRGPNGAASESLPLDAVGFAGRDLLALLERPEPDPVVAGIAPPGNLTLKVGGSYAGKTSQSLWCAYSRLSGVAPWDGAPAPTVGRVLILSPDEAPEQVARRLRALAVMHPAGRARFEEYVSRLTVVGPDRDVPPASLDRLRLDPDGLLQLDAWLLEAERCGTPFAEVFIDAYSDVLPVGESENDNTVGGAIGGALQGIAVRSAAAIVLHHHTGKTRPDASADSIDLRFLARGNTQLAAKARVLFGLEEVPGSPHLRRIRTRTNLGQPPKTLVLRVCEETDAPGTITYFKREQDVADLGPSKYLAPGEAISTNELGWRIAGREPAPGERLAGTESSTAARCRNQWQAAGLVEVFEGARRAKMMRLKKDYASAPAQ